MHPGTDLRPLFLLSLPLSPPAQQIDTERGKRETEGSEAEISFQRRV
jgi:hypothetical protein